MKPIYLIDIPIDSLQEICKKWSITELSLFGSVLRADFTDESDIDMLVNFDEPVTLTFKDWDAIETELSLVLGRPVDLVDKKAIEASPNYIRRKEILGSAQVIYTLR